MRIAAISDTHDNEDRTKALVKEFNEKVKPDAVIHCGDLISPFILVALNQLKCPVYICFGYQDGGEGSFALFEKKGPNIIFSTGQGTRFGEIKEEKVAYIHTPVLARALASTGDYVAVFYGHTHKAKIEKVGNCWLVNPGEIMGRQNNPTYVIYDTKLNKPEIINFK
jgi:putative phosphoesterase